MQIVDISRYQRQMENDKKFREELNNSYMIHF
jgi:hypothetical protein